MADKKYMCIKKTYYLSRLWRPARKDVEADVLFTSRTDVPLTCFRPSDPPKKKAPPRRKPAAKAAS